MSIEALRERLPEASTRRYNLLEADTEDRLARDPRAFEREVLALPARKTHVVVDEIQKVPRLLDAVHNLIETHAVPQHFVMTGSSARKVNAGSRGNQEYPTGSGRPCRQPSRLSERLS